MISDKQVTAEELYAAIHGKCVAVDDFNAALLRERLLVDAADRCMAKLVAELEWIADFAERGCTVGDNTIEAKARAALKEHQR